MSEVNEYLEEARARAASRAAVLQSLELAYKPAASNSQHAKLPSTGSSNNHNAAATSKKEDNNTSKPSESAKQSGKKRAIELAAPAQEESLSSKAQVDVAAKLVVDSLQTQYYSELALQHHLPSSLQLPFSKRPNYDRMGEFFKDNLQGKAIVLENSAAQSKASKAEARLRRQKNRVVQLSNRQAKAQKLLDFYSRPPMHEMRILHQHWLYYVRQIIGKDTSMLSIQLQAKFLSLELKGAKAVVVQHCLHPRRAKAQKLPHRSKDVNYTGITGYITHATSSSYYIAPDMEVRTDAPKYEQNLIAELNRGVIKLEREYCDLAVVLPRLQQRFRAETTKEEKGKDVKDEQNNTEEEEAEDDKADKTVPKMEESLENDEDIINEEEVATKDDCSIHEEAEVKAVDAVVSSGALLMLYGKQLHPHAHVVAGMAEVAATSSGNNNGNASVLVGGSSLTMSQHKSATSCATKLSLR